MAGALSPVVLVPLPVGRGGLPGSCAGRGRASRRGCRVGRGGWCRRRCPRPGVGSARTARDVAAVQSRPPPRAVVHDTQPNAATAISAMPSSTGTASQAIRLPGGPHAGSRPPSTTRASRRSLHGCGSPQARHSPVQACLTWTFKYDRATSTAPPSGNTPARRTYTRPRSDIGLDLLRSGIRARQTRPSAAQPAASPGHPYASD
jgi:hypothetical protein